MAARKQWLLESMSHSCVLIVIFLVLGCNHLAAQQTSPLLGQNPGGPPSDAVPTPVYVNIILNKLLSVDAVNYRFEVRMDVALSWRDERVPDIFSASEVAWLSQRIKLEERRQTCVSQASDWLFAQQNGTMLPALNQSVLETCTDAAVAPEEADNGRTCNRLCIPGYSPSCCDAVWIPDLSLDNVVGLSQDRQISDTVIPVPVNGSSGATSAVIRTVKVQATFTARMGFEKFPLDTQQLEIKLGSSSYRDDFTLVASGVSKDSSSGLFRQDQSKVDELPTWAVDDVMLTCYQAPVTGLADVFNEQAQDPDDPISMLQSSQKSISGDPWRSNVSRTCSLVIHVHRQTQYYIWNTLFPVVCTVHLSVLVFFMSPRNLELRMATIITLFLALTALQFTTNAELPSASYLTAYHKILLTSYLVIVSAGAESLLVYHVVTRKENLEILKTHSVFSQKTLSRHSKADAEKETCGRNGVGAGESPTPEAWETSGTEGMDLEDGSATEFNQPSPTSLSRSEATTSHRLLGSTSLRHIAHRWARTGLDAVYGYKLSLKLDSACLVIFPVVFWVLLLIELVH